MSRAAPVDREPELNLFDQMLAGNTDEHILLISATSGWGKSELLREFTRRCSKKLRFATLDFKPGGIGLAELLSCLCDSLNWANFPILIAAVNNIAQPVSVTVSNNLLIGQNQIEVALSGSDEQTREARRAALTTAFFSDLRALGQVLLIFDTFEKCDESVKAWLGGTFLHHVHHSPNLIVVVAGQKVPEESIDWECQHIPLGGIAAEHWHQHANTLGVTISMEFVQGLCFTCNGHPVKMANYLASLSGQRRAV